MLVVEGSGPWDDAKCDKLIKEFSAGRDLGSVESSNSDGDVNSIEIAAIYMRARYLNTIFAFLKKKKDTKRNMGLIGTGIMNMFRT